VGLVVAWGASAGTRVDSVATVEGGNTSHKFLRRSLLA
jgi:hypothetical protein